MRQTASLFRQSQFRALFLFVFLYIILWHGVVNASSFGVTSGQGASQLVDGLPTLFAAVVGISCSPFIALTVLSGIGSLLNAGFFDASAIPFAETLTELPISQLNVFIPLIAITAVKGLLELLSSSKMLCDATLGKLENVVGILCTVVGTYFAFTVVTVSANTLDAQYGGTTVPGGMITAAAMPVLAYGINYLIKTFMTATGLIALIVAPIPGMTALFSVVKYFSVGAFVLVSIFNPMVGAVIGLVFLVIAVLFFKWSRRLVLYYRRVYILPFLNSIFRGGRVIPVKMKRLPAGVAQEFGDVTVCVEAFFMNKTTAFKKRERCCLVRAGDANYLFKRRLLGKKIKIKLDGNFFIEDCFRFIRISTDSNEHLLLKKIHFVVSREQSANLTDLI